MKQPAGKEKGNHRLLREVGAVVIVLFLAAVVINGISIFYFHMQEYISEKVFEYIELLNYSDYSLSQSGTNDIHAEWFMPYLKDHPEDFSGLRHFGDSTGENDELLDSYEALYEDHPELYSEELTVEELDRLTPKEKAVVGSYYMSVLFFGMNTTVERYEVDEYAITAPVGDKEEFVYFSAKPGSDDTHFGEVRPSAVNWASPGKADDVRVIRSRADGKFYLFVQRPVVLFGQTLGHITVRNDLTGVIHDNIRAILGVELINFAILLLAAVVILALLNRIAMKPLLFVQRSVREYKENKDSNTVVSYTEQIRSKNEVGILARDVRDMAVELDRFTEEVGKLSSEKEKLNTELSVSASIQAQMIPHDFPAFPERGEFSLFASMTPAREVGGDFYDFFLIDEDHLALVMGDVSGKGIPAALFMMVSMTMIQNTALAKRGDSPAAILNEVNDLLYRNNETMMFVTVWFAILTLSTGRMVETNAGHEYPLLKKRGGEYEILKRKHSFVMGVRPGAHYTDDEIQMEKGDAVFIYTDGLPDATNAAGERLEEERMIEAVNRHKEEEPEPLLRSIHEEVNAYVGEAPQFDDLTMLCVTWVGRD